MSRLNKENIPDKAVEELYSAVLERAVRDYLDLWMGQEPTNDCNMTELKKWFASGECATITQNDDNCERLLHTCKVRKLWEIIELYDEFLKEDTIKHIQVLSTRMENVKQKNGKYKKRQKTRVYEVEPRLMDAFVQCVKKQRRALLKELEELENGN